MQCIENKYPDKPAKGSTGIAVAAVIPAVVVSLSKWDEVINVVVIE